MPRNTQNQTNTSVSSSQRETSGREKSSRESPATETQSRDAGAIQTSQSDRERSIETRRDQDRDSGRSRGLARRPDTSPVYGGLASNPFTLMRRMAEDMDRLFQDFGFGRSGLGLTSGSLLDDDMWSGGRGLAQAAWSPQVETFRRGDNIVIRADIPGVRKEDVNVEIDNDMLSISGERREEHEEDRDGYYRSERSYGRFYRAIPLPEGVSEDQCQASFNDGVLEVTLRAPKQGERKAKQIQVK
jgi:HSP20 family protein